MKSIIDTIFNPVLNWLDKIISAIQDLSVPVSRAIDINVYLGPLALLGPYWVTFITTVCFLAFVYMVTFIIVAQQGLFIKFKDTIKWW